MTLRPVPDGPAVVVCTTCRFAADAHGGGGMRDGATLAATLHKARAADPAYAGVAVQEMVCLFACADGCAVHLRAPDKIGYVLGRFAPDVADARAILDFAARYADSDVGEVPYADWPEGVKGRFLVRTPPAGFVVG